MTVEQLDKLVEEGELIKVVSDFGTSVHNGVFQNVQTAKVVQLVHYYNQKLEIVAVHDSFNGVPTGINVNPPSNVEYLTNFGH